MAQNKMNKRRNAMKYSEPLVVQGTSEVTPRSTCTEKFNCTTGAKFSCLLGIFFHCSGTFSCTAF